MLRNIYLLITLTSLLGCNAQDYSYKEKTYNALNKIYRPKDSLRAKTLLNIKHDLCNSEEFLQTDLFTWLIDKYDSRYPNARNISELRHKGAWKFNNCDFSSNKFDPSKLKYFTLTAEPRNNFDINEGYSKIESILFNKEFIIVVTDFYNMKTARLFIVKGTVFNELVWETYPRLGQE